jgi:hypothetical protein
VLIAFVAAAVFAEEQNESRVPKAVGSDGSEPEAKIGCVNCGKFGISSKFLKNSELLKVSRLPCDEVMSGEKRVVL